MWGSEGVRRGEGFTDASAAVPFRVGGGCERIFVMM